MKNEKLVYMLKGAIIALIACYAIPLIVYFIEVVSVLV